MYHPVVHSAFGEELFFLLVSTSRTPPREAEKSLSVALEQLGIKANYVASLFGPDDVLVRAWMTDSQRRELRRFIKDDMRWRLTELACERVEYLWAEDFRDIRKEEVAARVPEIKALCERQPAFFDADDDTAAALKRDGLLFALKLRGSSSIKFYVHITPVEDRPGAPASALRTAVADAVVRARCFEQTLHQLEGGALLVKVVVDGFDAIAPVVFSLADIAAMHDFATTTLIVMHQAAVETDHVAFGDQGLGPDLALMCQLLGGGLRVRLSAATPRQRLEISEMYGPYAGVAAEAVRRRDRLVLECLRGIFSYNADPDNDYLNRVAAPVCSVLEYLLRGFVPRFLAEAAGADWFPRLAIREILVGRNITRLDSVGRSMSKDLGELSLADLAIVLGDVAASNPWVATALNARLPTDWMATLGKAPDYRNDILHGRIVGGDGFVTTGWNVWAPMLCRICELIVALSDPDVH